MLHMCVNCTLFHRGPFRVQYEKIPLTWNFLHSRRDWCDWQLSGMLPKMTVQQFQLDGFNPNAHLGCYLDLILKQGVQMIDQIILLLLDLQLSQFQMKHLKSFCQSCIHWRRTLSLLLRHVLAREGVSAEGEAGPRPLSQVFHRPVRSVCRLRGTRWPGLAGRLDLNSYNRVSFCSPTTIM